jgi:hypothetical protein
MKSPSVYTDLCFTQVFENTTVGSNSRCLSAVKSASCALQLLLTLRISAGSRSRSVTSDARFTKGRLRQLKSTQISVTIEK